MSQSQSRALALLLCLFLGTLTGCAALTPPIALPSTPLPDGFAVKRVARADLGAPFALSRSGAIVTVAEGTLQFVDPAGGPGRSIAPAPASQLSFSPSGERLAAAFSTADRSLLQLFDLQGKILAEAIIPGRVTSVLWRSERELLATALEIKKFSFGSELISLLYRWDTVAPPVATRLGDVTVRPRVANLPEADLTRSLNLALSPYGDEIVYSSLTDPPLFTPYLRIALRHLESGAEREVAKTGIGSGSPLYAPDSQSLVVGDTHSLTRQVALPGGREINAWPAPGDHAALSPSGSYLLLDGHLYQEGRDVVLFPSKSVGTFLPDGSGIAISHENSLFLVTGLNDTQRPALPGDLKGVLELRRQLMQGQITDQEFKARLKKLSAR
jgi:hypothetical protein